MSSGIAAFETARPVDLEPVFFNEAVWERREENGKIGYMAIPGTWFVPDAATVLACGMHAMVSCPACKGVSVLLKRLHKIDGYGHLKPSFICTHERVVGKAKIRCSFNRDLYLNKWNKQPLYAVALEHPTIAGGWRPEIVYCHASNEKEARRHCGPGNYRVVAVGPVVGYWQDNETGKISV